MTSVFPVRRILSCAAVAAAAILASCAQAPPPAPPPPPMPSVSLAPRVIQQASAYRYYIAHATAISPGFGSGESVSDAVRTGAAYEPKQLLQGAIAYGAVAALQDQAFVAGVRQYAVDPAQRQKVAYAIMSDPAYVVGIQGSGSAAGLVMNALGDDGRKLLEQGKRVKQAAYDVQHSAWSKSDVAGRDARLALAKQLSATPVSGETDETSRLQLASTGGAPLGLTAGPVSPPYTPLVIRSLAVAALAALGYANDNSIEQVTPMLAETNSATCLGMSKLNLYQCLAVSKPYYEDVFCLGQHIMMDTGSCLMKGAGVPLPVDVRAQPLAIDKTLPSTPVSTKSKAKAKPKRAKG
jgi:hypothetical protein